MYVNKRYTYPKVLNGNSLYDIYVNSVRARNGGNEEPAKEKEREKETGEEKRKPRVNVVRHL